MVQLMSSYLQYCETGKYPEGKMNDVFEERKNKPFKPLELILISEGELS